MSVTSSPLQWPMGWPRTKNPARHISMSRNFSQNRDELVRQLELMGARDIVISSNLSLRRDGLPYSGQAQPDDRGIAAYFTLKGEQQCIPCDRWDNIEQNLRAIALTVEALRGLDRWGAKEMVDAAFRGFKALPESVIVTPYTARAWYDVLEVSQTASPEVIKAAYRQQMLKAHPDQGGSPEAFAEVQQAFQQSGAAS